MSVATFEANPTDPIDYMLNYLSKNHGNQLSVNANERAELNYLREDVKTLRKQLQSNMSVSTEEDKDDSSDSEAEEVVMDLAATFNKPSSLNPRRSVSAESFGNFNKKEDFKPPTYPKTEEQMTALRARLE